ncbi:MAG: 6-carboxytetrahydropterin synthase, partial [Candidatus Hydrogenedentes bacterium]|nr:6-carboxytetrahydropterin synthase [Candidatus Hydrogenedentota bacterium]
YLPQLPPEHPCSRLHGHSYRAEVGARDIEGLRPCLAQLYEELDHRCLNDLPGLERATCEVMCRWLWERLSPDVADLTAVVVQETDTSRCAYFGT